MQAIALQSRETELHCLRWNQLREILDELIGFGFDQCDQTLFFRIRTIIHAEDEGSNNRLNLLVKLLHRVRSFGVFLTHVEDAGHFLVLINGRTKGLERSEVNQLGSVAEFSQLGLILREPQH